MVEKVDSNGVVPRIGYVYVILAAVMWAVSGTSGKYLFIHGLTPYDVVQLRLTISTPLLGLFLAFLRPDLLRIKKSDVLYFAVLGILGMGMVQFTYFYAISKIKVAAAILLEYLAPAFITLYSVVIARERVSFYVFLALAGATFGCFLVVGGYDLDLLSMNKMGILGGLGAALSFAWYSVHGERGMRRYSPWTVFFYALLFATLLWNLLHPPLTGFRRDMNGFMWLLVLYIAIFGTLVPFGLYFLGINLIRSTRASITATLEPITAGFVSFFFLGEKLDIPQILGGLMVIGSVIMLQLKKEYDPDTPALIRAQRERRSP
ncbi:DMT family transporter [Thermodesulforhabdus norvegica]|uniref:Threonine/homoserine efflux transporter RhtA n=1 Tax=Thermodesulforhabdus norvegica TaxID=39841 RepID=A0A1I4SML7_9BACT|nr:EamA family transporter [Thermodesulforhabdus norvegica]SFM65684.1 Threonine/homoserine efflux transporter RhtA [Thermodesulforhabdus norvegica]